jgi:hypothetical protein
MFSQLTTYAEPSIIGVKNGLYQIEVDENTWMQNEANIRSLMNQFNVNVFLENQNSIIEAKI